MAAKTFAAGIICWLIFTKAPITDSQSDDSSSNAYSYDYDYDDSSYQMTDECGGSLAASSGGTVTSPNYPSNYGNNGDCKWSITAPEGSIIRLTFDSFDTEEDYDVLTIYDGYSDTAAELQRLSGQPLTPITPITSTSNMVFLRFKSDVSRTRQGFQLSYISRVADHCWDPGVPANGTRDTNSNFTPGLTVRYTCMAGYQLWGTANITCQSNSTWSDATPTCAEPSRIRLVGGSGPNEGRVEVRPADSLNWGTVCNNNFDMKDADVLCRMLGYIMAIRVTPSRHFGQGSGPIYMDDLRCDGNETSLYNCSYAGWGIHECHHGKDVGVVCDTSKIRLVGGSSPNEGRVEVRSDGSFNWGTICHDNFDRNDADVVCRMLGYPKANQDHTDAYFGQETGPIYMDDLGCHGNESSLFDCSYAGWTIHDCDHGRDASVVCLTNSSRIRLVGGSGPNEGRVEVRPADSSRWGTVCHDHFDFNDAEVVCRMLGYPNAYQVRPAAYFDQGTGPIYMDDLQCDGTENSLFNCSYPGWWVHNCGHWEDAGVVCDSSRIRLVGGSGRHEGRVEVRPDDSLNWGTVCQDQFDMKDADVVCRMLGLPSALQVGNESFFGPGRGPIYMDDLQCNGTETSLFNCSYGGWEIHDCDHDQDAGVVCGQPFLLVHAGRILQFDVSDGSKVKVALSPWAEGFDYDPMTDVLYWMDQDFRVKRGQRDGSGKETIIESPMDGAYNLRLDNAGGNIYWTNYFDETISVARMEGSFSRTLLTSSVIDLPDGLVLDPRNGLMYWMNAGSNPRLDRAAMDGSDHTTIISDLGDPFKDMAITIDYKENRLYYSSDDTINSSDMLGNDIRLVKAGDGDVVEGIAVDDNYIYWTQQPGQIRRLSKSSVNSNQTVLVDGLFLPQDIYLSTAATPSVTNDQDCTDWTAWFDRDDPSGTADKESLSVIRQYYPGQVCEAPTQIEARVSSSQQDASETGEVFEFYNTTAGFSCRNDDQTDGMCQDYEVRFCCNSGVWLSRDPSWIVYAAGIPWVNNGVTYDAAKALDGVHGTYWNPTGLWKSNNWYIILNLRAPKTLTKIAVSSKGDTDHDIAAFTLQKSQVGSPYSWEDVVSVTNVQGGTDERQEFGGFQGTARFWRFVITRTHSGHAQPYLRELNLFGLSSGCSSHNGGCQELCLVHPEGIKCACRDNWDLQEDGVTCCPSGYTAYGGACFKAYNQDKTYNQARQVCAADGGLLAMPKDVDTDNFLRDLKNAVNEISRFWFGLNDQKDEGEWMWEDGTPHNKTTDWDSWQLGEPNEGGEDCANYDGSEWNDAPCSSAYKFICQRKEGISCSLGYYRCGHGRACIQSWKRCDGVTDCTDGSDEDGCVCLPIPGDFQLDSRLAMLPNQLGQMTFEEIQNSSVMELLNSSYSTQRKYHPELREFVSTVIFPQCNDPVENEAYCSPSQNATNMTSCMRNVTGTQLVPCRSWCEEVLNMAADWIKDLLPRCSLFPSSKHSCWNPKSAKRENEVCYHGIGINYRGTWSKTTSGSECVEWSAAQAGYYKTEYPWANLDNNYCRNPTSLDRPFCLTKDDDQEECDVIPCDAEGCWDRGPPNYGKRSPSKRFYIVGERVTYTCNEGYTLKSGYTREVRCIGGGIWQYDKPSCSVNHKQRLQDDLLEIYSASLPPENVVITFTGSVEQLVDLDEKKEQLVASIVIDFTWQDSRLSWDPNYHVDITTLSVPGSRIWTPVLTLKRDANPGQGLPKDVPVRVSSNGRVEWSVETLTTTVCDADPFYFPADTMECHVCFAAIKAMKQTIQCQSGSPVADKDNSPCNSYSTATHEGEWYRKDKIYAKDNREACFAVHLQRIPLFHIATTVGPCIILVVLMIITFIMPLDRGDRISFGVTILLSMVVSLVFVTDVLPVKGALPFFATLIIVCMGLMGLFLLFTLAIIIIHDKEGSLSPTTRIIFLRYISKMMLLGDLTEEKRSCDAENGLTDDPAKEKTNYAYQTDGVAAIDFGDGNGKTGHPSTSPASLEATGSSGFSDLISSVKEVKNEVREVKDEIKELAKAMANEEEVSDYTLLAKVLDRLSLVLYIVSIAASVPVTMYFGK